MYFFFTLIKFNKWVNTTNPFNKQFVLELRNPDPFNKYIELVSTHIVKCLRVDTTHGHELSSLVLVSTTNKVKLLPKLTSPKLLPSKLWWISCKFRKSYKMLLHLWFYSLIILIRNLIVFIPYVKSNAFVGWFQRPWIN